MRSQWAREPPPAHHLALRAQRQGGELCLKNVCYHHFHDRDAEMFSLHHVQADRALRKNRMQIRERRILHELDLVLMFARAREPCGRVGLRVD